MSDAAISEFPFVETLPVAKQKRVRSAWDNFNDYVSAVAKHGVPLPQWFVAKLLNVSKQRVGQFVEQGRLAVLELDGVKYVIAASVEEFAAMERKNGRPFKVSRATWGECFESSREVLGQKKT